MASFFCFVLLLLSLLTLSLCAPLFDLSYYRATPSGYILAHCVHKVASGTHLEQDTVSGEMTAQLNGNSHVISKCDNYLHGSYMPTFLSKQDASDLPPLPADYNGWLQYTEFNLTAAETFDSFLGKFSVPNAPARVPVQLFIFTGLQNVDWIPKVDPESQGAGFDIIQPVLQYPGDNGNYWSVKSWFVTLDIGAIESNEVRTVPGDVIFGNMTRTGATTWFVNSVSIATKKYTSISVNKPRLKLQPWAYCVLEGYGVTGCSDYPDNTLVFSELSLVSNSAEISPKWKLNPKPCKKEECHEATTVTSPSEIQIMFQ